MNFFALQLLFFAFAHPSTHFVAKPLPGSSNLTVQCHRHSKRVIAPQCLGCSLRSVRRLSNSSQGFVIAYLSRALPLHISSLPFSAVAGYRIAAPRLGYSSPFPAMPSQRPASLGNAVAKHIASIRSYAVAAQVMSMLCHCFTLPCNSFAPRLKAVP